MSKPIILEIECIVCNELLHKINHDPADFRRKMGKIANRRSRTPNWSVEEKQYLLELIKQRRGVITKTTNGPNYYEEKEVAWNEILRELALKFGNKFTGSSIKKVKTQWQNMKRIARDEITLNGPELQKYSRQSLEVCNILDLMKDGVPRNDSDDGCSSNANSSNANVPLNDAPASAPVCIVPAPNIEIKTERIEEDIPQPSCSTSSFMETDQPPEPIQKIAVQVVNPSRFETSSSSDQESQEFEPPEQERHKDVSANTDCSYMEDLANLNPLHRNFQEFVRFTAVEKQVKIETLKEERQIVRAMRETAELNKIIAEQRLKHFLWVKRAEITMYTAGSPGAGVGKGGGGLGTIRQSGGAFGKREAAKEDEYFLRKQKEQLAKLKAHHDREIKYHEEQIKRHQEAIQRHKDEKEKHDKNE